LQQNVAIAYPEWTEYRKKNGLEPFDDLPANAEEIRVALLDAFDRQRQVDLAARLVARHLTLGHALP
jgi:hypothetical protein